jgi:hypothetical protein
MDTDQFWAIVEKSRAQSSGDPDGQAEALRRLLTDLPAADVLAFQIQLVQASRQIYTWEHGAAAEMVFGHLGDDSFTDFRTWVIARGRAAHQRFLSDPDQLAALFGDADGEIEEELGAAELFGVIADEVFHTKAGQQIWEVDGPILEPDEPPSGARVALEPTTLRQRFPRLASQFLDA